MKFNRASILAVTLQAGVTASPQQILNSMFRHRYGTANPPQRWRKEKRLGDLLNELSIRFFSPDVEYPFKDHPLFVTIDGQPFIIGYPMEVGSLTIEFIGGFEPGGEDL